jgi:hypothetical protein
LLSFSWLRGAVRLTTKQEEQEDDDARVVVFLAEKSYEDSSKTRILGR